MKKKFYQSFILIFAFACITHVNAQTFEVKNIIILNEGHYDYVNGVQTVPVTIGAYNIQTKMYAPFDTIWNARFATDVLVNGNSVYAAADSFLIRYDLSTHARLYTQTVKGIRKLALWNNHILASRGEYGVTYNSYVQVFDKTNLSFVYQLDTITGPKYASEGIIIKDNTAYVAIGNGFEWGNEKGLLGVINLSSQSYQNEIDLGAGATNPEKIVLDGDKIYTVNNTDYSEASVSRYDISGGGVTTTNLATHTGCGASGFANGFIYYQAYGGNSLGRVSTSTMSVYDTLQINKNIYGFATDDINHLIYVGETDFTSYGKIFICQFNGSIVDSFNVGIAPGSIALDIQDVTGIMDNTVSQFQVYPNPNNGEFKIENSKFKIQRAEIYSVQGEKVFSKAINGKEETINCNLTSGIYFLQLTTEEGIATSKIVRY